MNDNFAIQLFEGKKVRIVWDAEKEKYYFAVADIVQVLTDSEDVKQYIKRMRARDAELNSNWGTICTPLEMLAPDGKRRKTNAADLKGIFRIIQSIPSKKAEPVKKWLAEVATTELSRQRNPKGMAQSRKTAHEGGEVARNARADIESRLGRSVISSKRASDYIRTIAQKGTDTLPFTEEEQNV